MVFTQELYGNPKRKLLNGYPQCRANLLFKSAYVKRIEAVNVMQNEIAEWNSSFQRQFIEEINTDKCDSV